MLDIEEPSFDGLLQEIQGGLEKVQECVSKLQKYADKDSSCARFASPARHRKGSKESLCGEERPERPQLLRKSVSFLPNEMEAPVAGERKSDTQSGTSSNQLSKGDSQDYVSIAKTLGLGIGLLSRQISQAFVPRETWIEDLGGDEDVFQDILEDLAEKYAQKPDTQSRPVLPPSASECEEQKSSHCGCARCCRLRLMMHPQSRRRLIWDSVSVFMISVDMIMLPMIYGMDISEVLEVLVVEWICTIFWSVDMIITFMTGYTMGPDVIMNPRKVAIHYLTTWFAVDFAIVGSEWASRITEFVAGFNAFRAARAVRVLRVVRVVRLIRLARFVKTLQKFTEMTGSLRLLILFNVMKLTLFLLLAVHVFSCGWHFVGLYTDGGWIAKEGYVGESVIVRYVAAVRWTLSQLNGRTDRQDRTFTEMLYVAFTACFTLIFMSIFVSSLTSRMLQLQQLMDRESGYKRLLQRYNEMHNLSFTTVYLAKRHIRDRMTLESDMDTEKELLRLLPVQTQVCVYPDGTRITSTIHESGKEVELFKVQMPLVRCDLPLDGTTGSIHVECADGTNIEVLPGESEDGSVSIVLTCREGHQVKAMGDGTVQIVTRQGDGPNYMADCREGKLQLSTDSGDFILHADQTLEVSGTGASPRCELANKAYLDENEIPSAPRKPRLFIVHGNGEAEELLSAQEATEILEAAKADTTALVVGPENFEQFKCHTIFHTRLPDALSAPSTGSVALPDSLDGGGSRCSVISQASEAAQADAQDAHVGTVTEFRQLLEFPQVSEEDQIKLQGTLKQYRAWEAEQLKKMRDAAKPPEPKKTKKDKGKEKVKEKGKKGKKGKNEPEVVEEPKEIPPEPAFAQGLKLKAFDHHVKALAGRFAERPVPLDEELLSQALAILALSIESDKVQVGQSVPEPEKAYDDAEATKNLEEEDVKPAQDPSMDQENIAPSKAKKGQKRLSVAETEWSFSYFKSETGLQFLMDTGMLDPDMKPLQAVVKEKRPRPPPSPPPRSPWHPRLVGEPEDEPEEEASPQHEEDFQDEWPGQQPMGQTDFNVPEFGALPEDEGEKLFFRPGECRFPIAPVQDEAPVGPHPDKKAPMWDVYGEPRGPKGKISQAYVGVNTDYLEVEGPTGRKVNNSALAHKRTEVKAPPGGLGDNHMMVEVMPGACRFGLLRQGSLYRMNFYVRNLEVDVTRFNVRSPDSEFLRIQYQPGQLAPGMAAKLCVEVLALKPQRIEQLVEILTKAHVIRVPITAKIIGAEEYDRLDAESMALHGRHIGRHRERSETHRPGPVHLVSEPGYCKKVMGAAWQPLPTDFDDSMLH